MLNSIQRNAKNAATKYFFQPIASVESIGTTTDVISKNIVGWGLGIKDSGEDTVQVYVQERFPELKIPDRFGELPTDIVEVGRVTAYQDPAERHRPALGGVSVGHHNIDGYGTLSCLVEKNGNHYILSNNHVLAATNTAEVGDSVVQPGSEYGNSSPQDNIATLEPYQSIDFSIDKSKPNRIDAAIAKVGGCQQKIVLSKIIGIGVPRSIPISPEIDLRGRSVEKYGVTTRHTIGIVQAIDTTVRMTYNVGDRECDALFDGQILISRDDSLPFSERGDSGSLIVDSETGKPIALLFGGGNDKDKKVTYANPINLVLEHYGVTIVGE